MGLFHPKLFDGAMGPREAISEPSSFLDVLASSEGIDSSGKNSPHLAQAAG